jgi:hypothetical protein
MSWQELESEAKYIPFRKQDLRVDVSQETPEQVQVNETMTNLKSNYYGTNIQQISKADGGNLEIATSLRGSRTNGGLQGLQGMGKVGDQMKNYPEGPDAKFRYPADPSNNLDTERRMHYNYNNKAAIQDPLCTSVDPKKLNPISFGMLNVGIVQSNQNGYKSTTNGVHGKPFVWEAPKFVDKSNMPSEVDKELIEEAARSQFGFKVKYDHNVHGDVAISVNGAQEANLQAPQSNVISQSKTSLASRGIRGRYLSGRYAGLQAVV